MAKIIEHEMFSSVCNSSTDVLVDEAPYEYLNYDNYRNAFNSGHLLNKISSIYNKSVEIIMSMASDPDHGGKITISSLIETMVAFELERDGIMGITVSRGPKRTDLKDGWNRLWDVKAPPRVMGRFDANAACKSILHKFSEFVKNNIGIFLCVSFMNPSDYLVLLNELSNSIDDSQKYHIRQINIEGVL
ncbi:hypothetical protein CAXC1_330106 [Candidatus Xenohaliotis californiensis]|uniref:Restriction endonuclease type IV Mrr domain-containing protein n=1 Tax=Candidatus Xenohaliotis californiensis TaxID=84677 RepID=A0ABM9N8W6_9RICK|nr:hypothetical protein CAXC1_330106 [Candidatus Xenohaliotis californiensis]